MNQLLRNWYFGGGFNPKTLNPVFWIKDLSVVSNGYFVDDSGNSVQIQAATTNVANDSLIMPANNTAVINALKKAKKYYLFYTNDSTPKKVLISVLDCCSFNTQYFDKFKKKNLLLFSNQLSDSNSGKVFNYIKITRDFFTIEDKTWSSFGTWSNIVTAPAISEIVNNRLRQYNPNTGSTCFVHKTHLYDNGEALRITLKNVSLTGQCALVIGNASVLLPSEDINNYNVLIENVTGDVIVDNISTAGMTSNEYIGTTSKTTVYPNELIYDGIKIEKITYFPTDYVNRFDNIFDNSITYAEENGTKITSAKSEYSFQTDAELIQISALPSINGTFASKNWANIQVLVNDVHHSYANFTGIDSYFKEVTLPAGNKKVTLINAGTSKPSTSVIGCYLNGLRVSNLNTYQKLNQGTVSEKYLFLVDSIGVGANATYLQQGFGNLFKTIDNKEVGILGWGFAKLADFASDSTKIADTVSKIVAFFANCTGRKVLYSEIGTNDYGLGSLAAATFLTYYANLIDAVHIADPDILFFGQSPFTRGSESQLMVDYRIGMNTLCSSRNWAQYVHGPDVVPYNATNFDTDNVHLKDAGQQVAHDYIDDIILPFKPYFFYDNTFLSGTAFFKDLFDSTVINPAWTIINPDPTKVSITQDRVLKVKNLGVGTTTFFANRIESPTFENGAVKFSIDATNPIAGAVVGIMVDSSNRISLARNSSTNLWDLTIMTAGTSRYSLNSVTEYLSQIKITIFDNLIKIFVWNGTAWVQKGTDQTWNIGTNKKFFATVTGNATDIEQITIDDLFISLTDFNTLNP